MIYPTEDAHRGVQTSIDAAARAALTSSQGRRIALNVLIEHGDKTVDEVCAITDRPRYNLQPRFTELRKLGLIRDTGTRRFNASGARAIVWRAVYLDQREEAVVVVEDGVVGYHVYVQTAADTLECEAAFDKRRDAQDYARGVAEARGCDVQDWSTMYPEAAEAADGNAQVAR